MDFKGNLSRIGLGCMTLRDEEGVPTIRTALDAGVNFLDTGDFYRTGLSEMMVGEAIKGYNRDDIFISVKFGGMMQPGGGMYGMDVHPDRIKNYVAHSLTRLGVDYIDLYQPARLVEDIPVEETIGAIADLVKEGYIKNIGVSMVDADKLRRAQATHPIALLETNYSLFNRSMEEELLPTAREAGTKVIAFGLLAQGLLSGAWTQERVDNGDVTTNPRLNMMKKGNIEKNIILIERLRRIAEEKGCTLSQLVHAWALTKGDDVIPLIGASKEVYLQEALPCFTIPLTTEDVARIEAAVPADEIAGQNIQIEKFYSNGFRQAQAQKYNG